MRTATSIPAQDADVTADLERRADIAVLEGVILSLLQERFQGRTICPSEIARRLGGENWRELMEPVRTAAWQLASAGEIVILQHGRPVERDTLRGPIRLAVATASEVSQAKAQS